MSATWSDPPRRLPAAAMPAASLLEEITGVPRGAAWMFTVVTGDIEDADDVDALEQLGQLANRTSCLILTEGRNDETTWMFAENGGAAAVLAMQGLAVTVGRFWWTTHTRFGGAAR